jgi:hypothetical protein
MARFINVSIIIIINKQEKDSVTDLAQTQSQSM